MGNVWVQSMDSSLSSEQGEPSPVDEQHGSMSLTAQGESAEGGGHWPAVDRDEVEVDWTQLQHDDGESPAPSEDEDGSAYSPRGMEPQDREDFIYDPEFDDDAFAINSDLDSHSDGSEYDLLSDFSDGSSLESCDDEAGGAGCSAVPLLRDDSSVAEHGLMSSVCHHQCCDALSMASSDGDEIVVVRGTRAVLYDLVTSTMVASTELGFAPYSIAQHGDLFAAGGDHGALAIYRITFDKRTERPSFLKVADFEVGLPDDFVGAVDMVNGVRFGRCGSELHLIVAGQDRFVYFFVVPPKLPSRLRRAQPPPQLPASGGAAAASPSSSRPLSLLPPPPAARGPWSGLVPQGQAGLDPGAFLCRSLRSGPCAAGMASTAREVTMLRGGEHSSVEPTDVAGPYQGPVNCAAPSPDGRWLAVVGDFPEVLLQDAKHGYSMQYMNVLPFKTSGARSHAWRAVQGCQYVAWNESSSHLAASSDTLRAVRVWSVSRPDGPSSRHATRRHRPADVARASLVGSFGERGEYPQPCLAVQFDSLDDRVLYFLERSGRLHAVDTRRPDRAAQKVHVRHRLKRSGAPAHRSCPGGHAAEEACAAASCEFVFLWDQMARLRFSGKLTGLVASCRHGVLVSSRNCTLQYTPHTRWSPELHSLFPKKFKEAARTVLLAAHSGHESGGTGLRLLPAEVIHSIIGASAMPVSLWV